MPSRSRRPRILDRLHPRVRLAREARPVESAFPRSKAGGRSVFDSADRGRRVGCFARSRGQSLRLNATALLSRGRRGQERPVGLEAGIVCRRQDQDRQGPDLFGVRRHLFEPAAEIGQNRGVLDRGVVGHIDQCPVRCLTAGGSRFGTCQRIRGSTRRGARTARAAR